MPKMRKAKISADRIATKASAGEDVSAYLAIIKTLLDRALEDKGPGKVGG